MLTWTLMVLLPLSALLALAAPALSSLLLGGAQPPGSVELGARMLVVFAPQVALYGVGIVLTGVLQAHRRFLAAALAPLFQPGRHCRLPRLRPASRSPAPAPLTSRPPPSRSSPGAPPSASSCSACRWPVRRSGSGCA